MMKSYSRVLNAKVFGKVASLAPVVREEPVAMAKGVVEVLLGVMANEPEYRHEDLDGGVYWEMVMQDLGDRMGVSARMVGSVVSDLCLAKCRYRDGIRFFWNEAQVDVLAEALGVCDERVGYCVTEAGLGCVGEDVVSHDSMVQDFSDREAFLVEVE